MFRNNQFIKILSVSCLLCLLWAGCDTSIEPFHDTGVAYSIYGTLDLQNTPNYIRAHDTRAFLNSEATRDLDIKMVLTNLSTSDSNTLKDSVVVFDQIFTHNFKVESPIDFDTWYKIEIEDEDGFQESLLTKTTKRSQPNLTVNSNDCDDRFYIELSNIDLVAGEKVDAEVALKRGNTWHWTMRQDYYQYNEETNRLILGWSPNQISELLWPSPFANGPICKEYDSDYVRFRFTHIGYVEGMDSNQVSDEEQFTGSEIKNLIVLSTYSEEVEIIVPDNLN